jgi:pimeloyl-ACP methyl ester carboxylesterase
MPRKPVEYCHKYASHTFYNGISLMMRKNYVRALSMTPLGGFHRIQYTEWGNEKNPRVLICAHGLTRCGRDFDTLAALMSDRYRVVCPDIAGRGESDWLASPVDYNYPQYVQDMTALIARTGADEVHWVGTSMGGIIGMLLAAQANSPITRLLINDVGSMIPKASLERIGQYVGKSPAFESIDAVVTAVRAVSPFGPLTDEQWRALTLPLVKQTAEGKWQFRYDPRIGDAFRAARIVDVDLSPFWNAITCPVLVTRGADSDLLLRETYAEMCSKPNVKGVEFFDVGHAPMFQSGDQLSVIREFLS